MNTITRAKSSNELPERLEVEFKFEGPLTGITILLGPMIEAWNRQQKGVALVVDCVLNHGVEVWPKLVSAPRSNTQYVAVLRPNKGVDLSADDVAHAITMFENLGLDIVEHKAFSSANNLSYKGSRTLEV